MKKQLKSLAILSLLPLAVNAEEVTKSGSKVQDMSDPLAVYTQVGVGSANMGLYLNMGKSYDPGTPNTMAMNLLEIKGLLGETFGWGHDDGADQAVDSVRFRNFKVNTKDGRGAQVDFVYSLNESSIGKHNGTLSYSLIQALPKWGRLNLYPLAGLGATIAKDAIQGDGSTDSGFSFEGVFAQVGFYSKLKITDKIWFNYNPTWVTTLGGNPYYKDNAYGTNNSSVFSNEISLGYQITPTLNIRYFGDWNQYIDFKDGNQRIVVSYQL
ncbi:hypothetical protein [Colwellia echini]|uniref:Transporter n=1 Tax=Colwellia echini TaxID=1982103 RepID=A0ABY3MY25_9GAMM|nr:hypothetical protein [Colwellia echini]TYK66135.1 hypothetical protein CWS31_007670 [Colwellia echini]